MWKCLRYLILCAVNAVACEEATAQIAMPDTVCIGATRTYSVNDATRPSTYTWKVDGATQTSTNNQLAVTWNTAGVFLITVQEHSAGGCDGDVRSGTVVVKPPAAANAGPDATVCFGATVQLNGSGGGSYQWLPSTYLSDAAIANPVASIPVAGTFNYILHITNGSSCGVPKDDTVAITVLPQLKVFAGRDTSVVINQPVQLNAVEVSGSFVSYSWSPPFGLNNSSIKNPVAVLDRNITYIVTAQDVNGCKAVDDISIKVFTRADIFVPTAFTPNGDGRNDLAVAVPVGIKEFKYFSIYNRYGQLVFTTKDYTKGWDGSVTAKEQGSFTFVWIAEGIDYSGNVISKKGTVTLIR